jgi:hypothetical protein
MNAILTTFSDVPGVPTRCYSAIEVRALDIYRNVPGRFTE